MNNYGDERATPFFVLFVFVFFLRYRGSLRSPDAENLDRGAYKRR